MKRESRAKRREAEGTSTVQINMAPMIDVVFLLIVFFMLVTRFVSVEIADVELPDPEASRARELKLPDKVVLNLQHTPGIDEPTLLLGPFVVSTNEELKDRLTQTKNANPQVQVILRADRAIEYRYVRQAMDAVAAAGIETMNIGAQID